MMVLTFRKAILESAGGIFLSTFYVVAIAVPIIRGLWALLSKRGFYVFSRFGPSCRARPV